MNKKDMFIREKLQQDKEISDRANKIFDNIKEEFKMENNEKKVIKISLGTFIAIAASLVIVGFVGVNFYANSIGKPNIISGIQALVKDEPEINVDEIAKELFEKAMLSIRDSYKYYEDTDSEVEEIEGKYYKKTNSTYDEVELKYSEIFTEEALENVLALNFYNKEGVLYAIGKAGGTPWEIIELKVEKMNEEKEELTYNVIYKLSYTDDPASKEPKEQKCQFKMKKVDEQYKISATNFLNIDRIENNAEDNYEEGIVEISQTDYEIIKVYSDNKIIFSVTELWKKHFDNGILEPSKEYTITGVPNAGDYDIKIIKATEQTYIEPYVFITCVSEDHRECSTYTVNTIKGFKTGNFEAKHLINGEYTINYTLIGNMAEYEQGRYYYEGPEFVSTTSSIIYHVNRENNGEIILREYKKQDKQTNNTTATLYGDVDLDGEVTDWDEIYLIRHLNCWNGYDLSENAKLNADVNLDGEINEVDVGVLQQYLVGNYVSLPAKATGVVSGANAMPEMLKYRNEEYRANYYYRLAGLRSNGNGTYTAKVDFCSPVYISEEKYKNMVDSGWGEVEGVSYTFSSKNNEFNNGYGYIYKGNLIYNIEKQDRGYAFYSEIGGVLKMIDTVGSSFEMTLDQEIVVKNVLGFEDMTLKECANTLRDCLNQDGKVTFEYSEEDNIYMLIDWR